MLTGAVISFWRLVRIVVRSVACASRAANSLEAGTAAGMADTRVPKAMVAKVAIFMKENIVVDELV